MLDGATEFLGYSSQSVAVFDGVVGYSIDTICARDVCYLSHIYLRTAVVDQLVGFVGINAILLLNEKSCFLGLQAESILCAAREYIAGVLRVEAAEFV